MTIWAFISAALKALPIVLDLIRMFKASADAKVQQGIGYDQAVKEALQEGQRRMALADEAERQARKDHAEKKDDSAFDPEFMRKD